MEKKEITIRLNDDGTHTLEVVGFNSMELLGLLRFHEKRIWVELMNPTTPPPAEDKTPKP